MRKAGETTGVVHGTISGACGVCGIDLASVPGIRVKVRRGPIPWVALCGNCVEYGLSQAWEAKTSWDLHAARVRAERRGWRDAMATARTLSGQGVVD